MKHLTLIGLLITTLSFADGPRLYAPDGTYLGTVNNNQYDPESVNNPYGQYGSKYAPDSIKNEYGQYGSPYSPNSVNYGNGSRSKSNNINNAWD
jgi:hypothetical protein